MGTGEAMPRCLSMLQRFKSSQVWRVAMTGGPCGGKTTALAALRERLPKHGVSVLVVPEFATMFFHGGAAFPVAGTPEHQLSWELSKMKAQMASEDAFRTIALSSGEPTVIVSDRGLMDSRAFVSDSQWSRLLELSGWDDEALRGRYDGVLHMVTTAIGAEQMYTQSNNKARRESVEEARDQDLLIRGCWLGHPGFRMVANRHDFAEKVRSVEDSVLALMGKPTRKVFKRSFVVEAPSEQCVSHLFDSPARSERGDGKVVEIDITSSFVRLPSDDSSTDVCLRKSVMCDSGITWCTMHSRSGDQDTRNHNTTSRGLTKNEYRLLLNEAESLAPSISMRQQCFVHENTNFKLDRVAHADGGSTYLLSLETSREGDEALMRIPVSIQVKQDASDMSLLQLSQANFFRSPR